GWRATWRRTGSSPRTSSATTGRMAWTARCPCACSPSRRATAGTATSTTRRAGAVPTGTTACSRSSGTAPTPDCRQRMWRPGARTPRAMPTRGPRSSPMARAAALAVGGLAVRGVAQWRPVVSYPRDYRAAMVKYAVVDRSDGMSRDLYVSPDAIDALRRDPRLHEFPAGVLFALDVHSARVVGRDPKTRA